MTAIHRLTVTYRGYLPLEVFLANEAKFPNYTAICSQLLQTHIEVLSSFNSTRDSEVTLIIGLMQTIDAVNYKAQCIHLVKCIKSYSLLVSY